MIIAEYILAHVLLGWNFVFIETACEKQAQTQFLILIGCFKITN